VRRTWAECGFRGACRGGWNHSLGLRADGSIEAWGNPGYYQCDVPSPNADFVAVAAGLYHSVSLKRATTGIGEPREAASRVSGIGIHALAPNPFNPGTVLTYSSRAAGRLTLSVYDLTGRLVFRQELGRVPAGQQKVQWDGRDAEGREVASGLYVFRITNSLGEASTVKGGASALGIQSFPAQWRDVSHGAECLTLGLDNNGINRLVGRQFGPQTRDGQWVLIGGPPCQAYSLAGRARRLGINKPEEDHRQERALWYTPAALPAMSVSGVEEAESA
jgi:hypothetical protein